MPDSLSRTFSKFLCNLTYDDLPPQVVDKVKASLLHAAVVSLVGAETHHGKAAINLAKAEESNPAGATILADGGRASRCGAAFANSKLMHVTNQSDSYRMLIHPGPCVIPSALATAELGGNTGKEFLTAMAAAYEVEARIAGDFIPSTQARGFRSSPVYGTLGAAVATGKLLRLPEDRMVTAIALACTFTGGTTQGPSGGGQEMLYHEPNATRNGIMAALLAQEDVRGSEASLEGDAGFYNAFTGNNRGELSYVFQDLVPTGFPPSRLSREGGPNRVELSSVVAGLGSRWELMHVTPKMYPTAGYNCPVIDLMTQIRARHQLSSKDVQRITVDMNWLETTYPSPAFPSPQRSSPGVGTTHYFAAYTFVHGSYPPLTRRIDPQDQPSGQSTDRDREVMDLLKKVEVVGHKDRRAFAPRISIQMVDGTAYQGESQGNEMEWGLDTETSRISEWFPDMSWPREQLQAIVDTVYTLEDLPRINPLIQLCVRQEAARPPADFDEYEPPKGGDDAVGA